MSEPRTRTATDREHVVAAIRQSWSAQTCGTPADWAPENPSWQQCDVSAFLAWEYLGGDLVLGKVFLDGAEVEHHYWNRIDGRDVDLTRAQFAKGEDIRETDVLSDGFLRSNADAMRPELLSRIAIMREQVRARLDAVDHAQNQQV